MEAVSAPDTWMLVGPKRFPAASETSSSLKNLCQMNITNEEKEGDAKKPENNDLEFEFFL